MHKRIATIWMTPFNSNLLKLLHHDATKTGVSTCKYVHSKTDGDWHTDSLLVQ